MIEIRTSKDQYKMYSLDKININMILSMELIWIDGKIDNEENKQHAKIIQQYFNLIKMKQEKQLISYLYKKQAGYKITLISCSSFLSQFYSKIQEIKQIDRVVLFCRNDNRAASLLRTCPKIKSAFFSRTKLIDKLIYWKRQDEKRLIIFNEQNIESINKYYSIIFSLINNSINILQSNYNFQQYYNKILLKIQDKQKTKLLFKQIEKIKNQQLIKNKLLQQINIIFSSLILINQILISINNPYILSYCRYFIYRIFHIIKNNYKINNKSNQKYYAQLELNQTQIHMISNNIGKYITFTYFLIAKQTQNINSSSKTHVSLIINVPPISSNRYSNGYIANEKTIMFNIGNYYKIDKFNKKTLKFETRKKDYNLTNEIDKIIINQQYQLQMNQKFNGQSYCLLLNTSEKNGMDLVDEKISHMQDERQQKKLKLNKYEYYIQNNILLQKLIEMVAIKPSIQKKQEQLYVKANLLISQYYWQIIDFNKQQKYTCDIQKLKEYLNKIKLYQVFIKDEGLEMQYRLLQIGRDIQLQSDILRFKKKLDNIQRQLEEKQISIIKNYLLMLKIQIRLNQKLKLQMQCLQLIDKLQALLNITSGRHSKQYEFYNELKKSIIRSKCIKLNQNQIKYKKEMLKCKVDVNQLRINSIPQIYKIDIGNIDLDDYD